MNNNRKEFDDRFYLDPKDGPMWGYTTDPVNYSPDTDCRDIGYHTPVDADTDSDGFYDYEEFWLGTNPNGATIWYVNAAASGGNGLSWSGAFKYVQDAINNEFLVEGDQIWVAGGTYYPDKGQGQTAGDRSSAFQLVEGVALYGGFAGTETTLEQRDWTAHETTLSGDIGITGTVTDNCYHVVIGADDATLDGFTITGGYADGADDNGYGGGMLNENVSPNVTKCSFKENFALYGGGMFNLTASPIVKNCLFYDNTTIDSSEGDGAAIYCYNYSDAVIENCTISRNIADRVGGGIIANMYSDLLIKNSIIWDNDDSFGGDDVDAYNYSVVTVTYSDLYYGYKDEFSDIIDTHSIYMDPLFADAANGDFHLKSAVNRWTSTGWVTDSVTSPCINAGDPTSECGNEPSPNGSRINMGTYGNTGQASQSTLYPLTVYLLTNDQAALPTDAKWYLDSQSGTLFGSGQTVMVSSGGHVINFVINSSTPYIAPSPMAKTITSSSTNQYAATYIAAGWITYVCFYYRDNGSYSEDGVGWKVSSETSFHNGQRKYSVGTYTVQFASVSEHATPANTQIMVTKNSSNSPYEKQYQRTTFYVDVNNGYDTNKGGAINPFETIQKALNMMPSDSVTMDLRYIYLYDNNGQIYQNVTFPSNKTLQIRTGTGSNIWVYGTNNSKPSNITCVGIFFD